MLSLRKAVAVAYVSRKKVGNRWRYTYAPKTGGGAGSIGKTDSGKTIHANFGHAAHASFSAGEHEQAASAHSALAAKHEKKMGKYMAAMESNPKDASARQATHHHLTQLENHAVAAQKHGQAALSLQGAAKERMATSNESEFASRAPENGSDKRMMSPAETGRLATTRKPASSPWDHEKSKSIGKTRSGHIVYNSPGHHAHEDFSYGDHLDAGNMHNRLAEKAQERGDTESFRMHAAQRDQHREFARSTRISSKHNERMATPSDFEHASRSPSGSDKRIMSPAETGRLATTRKPASSPWDNEKSLKRNLDMKKSDIALASIPSSGPTMVDNVITQGLSRQSADGLDMLKQMISDYENANFGSAVPVGVVTISDGKKDLDAAEKKTETASAGYAQNSVGVPLEGNAPNIPFGQPVQMVTSNDSGDMVKGFLVSQDQLSAGHSILDFFAKSRASAAALRAHPFERIN